MTNLNSLLLMAEPISNPTDPFFRCVEDSNEAIMMSDRGGKLKYVNPAWVKIYGYSKEEALGRTPAILHSGHQSNAFYQQMWSDIRNPQLGYWKGELINRSKDGSLIPVLLSITPIYGPVGGPASGLNNVGSGHVQGYLGIALDISKKKELEAQVVHQDRLASIGMLASGLAHEIGTPLGVMRGRSEILQKQCAEVPGAQKNLEVIISQIDRVSQLIKSLLRVSRVTEKVQVEGVSLHAVIDEALLLVGQHFKNLSAEIRLEVSPEIKVQADFGRLQQVFLNLFVNAVHAIRTAQTERKSGHFLKVKVEKRESKIAIEIADSGCGVAPEHMNRLFKPFFTTKEVGEGTGLGLAIVMKVLGEMGGEISVQSKVGVGTSFFVVLDAGS